MNINRYQVLKSSFNNIKVNADDFGLNPMVNKAIIEAFRRGLINSASIMANMPSFQEAVKLTEEHNLKLKVGAHLVLTQGEPLTADIQSLKYLFNGKQSFKQHLLNRFFRLSRIEKELIFRELREQIEKIREIGLPIIHIDTHHHVHEYYAIMSILIKIKNIYKVPTIRILNNIENKNILKNTYRLLLNSYLIKNSANSSNFFGDQFDLRRLLKERPGQLKNKSIEVMVHPDYDLNGILVDRVGNKTFDFDSIKLYCESVKQI